MEQIIPGHKTASVTRLGEVNIDENEYNHALVMGEYYDGYDSNLKKRCTIRITSMELARWDKIPKRLWHGETNNNPDEFRKDHLEYFDHPRNDFEFIAYYFELIKNEQMA